MRYTNIDSQIEGRIDITGNAALRVMQIRDASKGIHAKVNADGCSIRILCRTLEQFDELKRRYAY